MKKIIILATVATMMMGMAVCNAGYVRGHYRGNGTYVEGYHRSDSNGTTSDNWSHSGNYNPYTGARGYRND